MKRIKTGTMMYENIINLCDENLIKANVSSRNDFIEEAIVFYVGYLHKDDNTNYLNQVIDQTIKNKIDLLEEQLSMVLFKLSVEISMLMNIVASNNAIDSKTLSALRNKCIDDVRSSIGKVNFEEVIKYQNQEGKEV
ncbi:hypothetical protein K210_04760 [Erysipelothrix rhusiopathiae SY1027]|uniref:hypothetical protein n=1 Tax=Erysipelothrix rhusiopathiae TaxID=1648 RepID=UPI0003348B24|nr:hypothetical protein [Erysipelothrix rhusiopathiae]AGN24555.1 hypothetical protein K210_04760 [Erysipelothrix rhusiopathiae SY1027]